jgi:transcriptional regulator with XRE-family HTH domain
MRLKHQRLAELVAHGGLTQNNWAIKLGLSRGHWSDIVNGNHPNPSAKTRTRLLEAFDASFDELFEIDSAGDAWVDVDFQRALSDRFIIESAIGQGGRGAVHVARDVRHGRLVAIKVIAPEAASGVGSAQLLREMAAGQPYFVMPYVRPKAPCVRDSNASRACRSKPRFNGRNALVR